MRVSGGTLNGSVFSFQEPRPIPLVIADSLLQTMPHTPTRGRTNWRQTVAGSRVARPPPRARAAANRSPLPERHGGASPQVREHFALD